MRFPFSSSRRHAALKQAAELIDKGGHRSAVDLLKERALVKGEMDFNEPLAAALKQWFLFDKTAAFEELSACIYSSGGKLQTTLAATFKMLATRWHEESPEEAVKAIEGAQWLAFRDRSSLYAKVMDADPYTARPTEDDMNKAAKQSFIYKLSKETLAMLNAAHRPDQRETLSVAEFMKKYR